MSYYFIAQITIHDNLEYSKYIAKVEEVFSKFKGQYLTVDNNPQIIEGAWNYTRTVLIRFPSYEDFNDWYYSPEYQEILAHRLNAAQCDTILAKGLE